MRLLTLSKMLLLGATTAYVYKHRRRFSRPRHSQVRDRGEQGWDVNVVAADLIPDPGDPVQGFDEASDLHVADLDVDVLDATDAEAARDQAVFENDLDEAALELDTPSQTTYDAHDRAAQDVGELYGVHTPRAVDRELEASDDEGQNWIEALETSAIEYGAEPESEVDPVDDVDTAPHPSDMRDTPVADRGSGGPSGV